MIYIVHGDDIVKSRALIVNQQKKLGLDTKLETTVSETDPEKLFQMLNTPDIFGAFPFVVLDISQAGRTNLDKYVEAVKKSLPNPGTNLVILSDKTISKTNPFIKNIKELSAKELVLEKQPEGNVFNFVDALLAKNRTKTYRELDKLENTAEAFEIFSKIVFGVRNLMLALLQAPAFEKLHPFVKKKTLDACKGYTQDSIIKLFSELYQMDKGVKTGELETDSLVTLAVEKVLNS